MNLKTICANPWPYAVIGWMLLFGTGMAAWVVVAVNNDPELVRSDYYEQEIAYQQQIDRLSRTAAVRGEVSVAYDIANAQVALRLPPQHLVEKPVGKINFYRPSSAKSDFTLPLAVDAAGRQTIPSAKLQGGLWRVRVSWTSGGQEFFHDQPLVL